MAANWPLEPLVKPFLRLGTSAVLHLVTGGGLPPPGPPTPPPPRQEVELVEEIM